MAETAPKRHRRRSPMSIIRQGVTRGLTDLLTGRRSGEGGASRGLRRTHRCHKGLRQRIIRHKWKAALILLLTMLLGLAAVFTTAELWSMKLADGHCHDDVQDCPSGSVGLVLGCCKFLGKGRPNFYFTGRMQAAAELWKSGKVTCLIVSGDNSSRYYNEPRDMKEALIMLGVPEDRIVCDYAGFRTYDSVVRARDIFSANKLVIVSQPSHVQRAVAIARHFDLDAEGLNAPLESITFKSRFKQFMRERAARIAMVYDFLVNRSPAKLGEKQELPQ